MDVRRITAAGVEQHEIDELPALLAADEGVVWVDIPVCDEQATSVLADVFGFHPLAVRECVQRNRVPKVHAYPDHLFVILHGPELGAAGHVHFLELDQFVGPGYLVTVHGPVNPAVDPAVALRETQAVLRRIEAGRLRPATSFELAYAVVSALTRTMEDFIEELTTHVWSLEQRVTAGITDNAESFLDEMFRARHGLLAVRTMAALSREIYGRMAILSRYVPAEGRPLVDDVVDQFERIRSLADGQKDYLQGVIEFYRTRTDTKMMIAAERLAVVAVLTLPVTALASVYGMNLIANTRTDTVHLVAVLAVMAAMSASLLVWARRQGWW